MTKLITLFLHGATIILSSLGAPATNAPINDLAVGRRFTVSRSTDGGFLHPADLGEGKWMVKLDGDGHQQHIFLGHIEPVNEVTLKTHLQSENSAMVHGQNLTKRNEMPKLGDAQGKCKDWTPFEIDKSTGGGDPLVFCVDDAKLDANGAQYGANGVAGFRDFCAKSTQVDPREAIYMTQAGSLQFWCNYGHNKNDCPTTLVDYATQNIGCACGHPPGVISAAGKSILLVFSRPNSDGSHRVNVERLLV